MNKIESNQILLMVARAPPTYPAQYVPMSEIWHALSASTYSGYNFKACPSGHSGYNFKACHSGHSGYNFKACPSGHSGYNFKGYAAPCALRVTFINFRRSRYILASIKRLFSNTFSVAVKSLCPYLPHSSFISVKALYIFERMLNINISNSKYCFPDSVVFLFFIPFIIFLLMLYNKSISTINIFLKLLYYIFRRIYTIDTLQQQSLSFMFSAMKCSFHCRRVTLSRRVILCIDIRYVFKRV